MAILHGVAQRIRDDAGVVVPLWERMFNDALDELCHEAFVARAQEELLARAADIDIGGAVQLAIKATSAPTWR